MKAETRVNSPVHLGPQVVLEGLGLHPHSHPEGETNDRKTQGRPCLWVTKKSGSYLLSFLSSTACWALGSRASRKTLEGNKHISQELGNPAFNHCPSRAPRYPHRKSRLALSSATNTWSWGTLGKDSGSGDGHETQTPSHLHDIWFLTYPFPTITFVTLEDKDHDPITMNHTLSLQDTRRVTGSNLIIKIMGAGCGGTRL